MHDLVLQQSNVTRVYHVPWSVFMLCCFLKYHTVLPHVVSHPTNGSTDTNVSEWSMLAQATDGEGLRAWKLAITYLKEEGFLIFAGARPVQSQDQRVSKVDDATQVLINLSAEWLAELHMWCNSTRFRQSKTWHCMTGKHGSKHGRFVIGPLHLCPPLHVTNAGYNTMKTLTKDMYLQT